MDHGIYLPFTGIHIYNHSFNWRDLFGTRAVVLSLADRTITGDTAISFVTLMRYIVTNIQV